MHVLHQMTFGDLVPPMLIAKLFATSLTDTVARTRFTAWREDTASSDVTRGLPGRTRPTRGPRRGRDSGNDSSDAEQTRRARRGRARAQQQRAAAPPMAERVARSHAERASEPARPGSGADPRARRRRARAVRGHARRALDDRPRHAAQPLGEGLSAAGGKADRRLGAGRVAADRRAAEDVRARPEAAASARSALGEARAAPSRLAARFRRRLARPLVVAAAPPARRRGRASAERLELRGAVAWPSREVDSDEGGLSTRRGPATRSSGVRCSRQSARRRRGRTPAWRDPRVPRAPRGGGVEQAIPTIRRRRVAGGRRRPPAACRVTRAPPRSRTAPGGRPSVRASPRPGSSSDSAAWDGRSPFVLARAEPAP